MTRFHIHPSDLQRLRRWFRAQLLCCLIIASVLIGLRFENSEHNLDTSPSLNSEQEVQITPVVFGQLPNAVSVSPEGWRRTSRGWEHVSTWPSIETRSLGEIIKGQLKTEPAWIQFTLEKLRNVPPLMFAVLQITLLAVIVNVLREQADSQTKVN